MGFLPTSKKDSTSINSPARYTSVSFSQHVITSVDCCSPRFSDVAHSRGSSLRYRGHLICIFSKLAKSAEIEVWRMM